MRPGLSPLPWSVTGCSFFLGGKVILLWRQSLKGVLPASIPVAGTSPSYYVSSALQGLVGGASQSPLQSRPGHWEPGSSPFPSHELGETRTRPPLQLPPPLQPTCVSDGGARDTPVCPPFLLLSGFHTVPPCLFLPSSAYSLQNTLFLLL